MSGLDLRSLLPLRLLKKTIRGTRYRGRTPRRKLSPGRFTNQRLPTRSGRITFAEAIEQSSNVVFAPSITENPGHKFYIRPRLHGFGITLGIDVSG